MTTINGTSGDDDLLGTTGNDSIYGLEGDDYLEGDLGDDYLDGGANSKFGNDWADYFSATSAVTLDLSVGTATGGAGNDTLINIEGIIGSTYNDTLTGDANVNHLYGEEGNDTLSGGGGDDWLVGGAGDDYLDGGSGKNGGRNAANYFSASGAVTVNLISGTATGGAGNDTLINITDIYGSAYGDTLTGDANSNFINGADGNDTLNGGDGDDILTGDNGNDALDGGAGGKDRADYNTATSAVTVNLLTGTASGGAGNDTLINIEHIYGSAYNDTLTGDANSNTLYGSDGNDTLHGNAGDDQLFGDDGNDILKGEDGDDLLRGGIGDDTLNGGVGQDTADFSSASTAVIVNLSAGTATGDGSDTLTGIENINGSNYDDTLTGNAYSNQLNGGSGADAMKGGLGDDSYWIDNVGDVITESLNAGIEYVYSSITYTLPANVENLVLIYNPFTPLVLDGTGNSLANTLTGNLSNNKLTGGGGDDILYGQDGDDSLIGGTGSDQMFGGIGNDNYVVDNIGDTVIENLDEGTDSISSSVTFTLAANVEKLTLTGTSAIDGTGNGLANTLTGNSAVNQLTGGDGNDTLDGKAGADSMIGGLGNDSYVVDNTGDVINENLSEGTDKVSSNVTYTLSANVENLTLTGTSAIDGTGNGLANTLTGNSAVNQLTGGDGNDTLDGKAGADSMIGGLGNDSYVVDNTGDVINENLSEGTDKVSSNVTYTLSANVENLTLTGTSAINGTGNAQANTLTGNSGNNILSGGAGNDVLNGGTGTNTLTGGTGKDKFNFTTTGHIDTITDFTVIDDTIQLENAVFTALTATGVLAADQFVIGAAAIDGNDYVIYNSTTGALLYDADGSGAGAAVQIATIGTGLAMTSADIVVI